MQKTQKKTAILADKPPRVLECLYCGATWPSRMPEGSFPSRCPRCRVNVGTGHNFNGMVVHELGPSGWPINVERQQRVRAQESYDQAIEDGSNMAPFDQYFRQWMAGFAG